MVLFRDDELRMIAAERAAQPRWKKRLRLAIKIVLVLAGMFWLSLILMSAMAGHSDSLKRGIEQYLRQATGLQADVGRLNYMSFFPVVRVDFDDLALYEALPPLPSGKKGQVAPEMRGAQVATVGHVNIAIAFWDLFLGRHTIRTLDIDRADFASGLIDRRNVKIASLHLDRLALKGQPGIIMDGQYGDEDMSMSLGLEKSGLSYRPAAMAPFDFACGKLHADGTVGHQSGKGLVMDFKSLSLGGQTLTGTAALSQSAEKTKVTADLTSGKSRFTADFERRDGGPMTGNMTFPSLDVADVKSFAVVLTGIAGRWPKAPGMRTGMTIDALTQGPETLGRMKASLDLTGADITLSDWQGVWQGTEIPSANDRHLTAPATDLTWPQTGIPSCVAARFSGGGDTIKIAPVLMESAGHRYSGEGSIDQAQASVKFALHSTTQPPDHCHLP